MKSSYYKVMLILLLLPAKLTAEILKPGFDKTEYLELLRLFSRQGDSAFFAGIPASEKYHTVYHSNVVGLDNRWELAVGKDGEGVISIRGTTGSLVSWLENYYSAMVPAKGVLDLEKGFKFQYDLSDNPNAAVHIGWLIGTAYLSRDIVLKIDSCYKAGMKDFIIFGHSQGGAISYLLTSYLLSLQKSGVLPKDIRFKTYCSAAPKPGNLFYAYQFERSTMGGWAFNVVSEADWVPETPVAVQTVNDFNTTNPFIHAKKSFKKLKFSQRLVLNHVYNQLDKPSRKAQRKYELYLGKKISKLVKKTLVDFNPPVYFHSDNYVRAGNFIILEPDEAYYKVFKDNTQNVFIHHMMQPYYMLAQKLPEN